MEEQLSQQQPEMDRATRIQQLPARIVSNVMSPMLVPLYGAAIAIYGTKMSWLPTRSLIMALVMAFLFTGLLPMMLIILLHKLRLVDSIRLVDRRQRFVPYVLSSLCYFAGALYFHAAHAPQWFAGFFAGGGISIIVATIVTRYWKISGHAAAVGGMVALVAKLEAIGQLMAPAAPLMMWTVVLAGMTGTSRVMLGRHTVWQILAGFLNGFLCIYLT